MENWQQEEKERSVITKTALKKAISNPIKVNMDMVNAQIARQVLDKLVGFTLSPILWKYISRNTKASLSAGRCQTPALRLVYDNQRDIDNSPGKKVYDTTGYFTVVWLKNIRLYQLKIRWMSMIGTVFQPLPKNLVKKFKLLEMICL